MPTPFTYVPEDVKKEAVQESEPLKPGKRKKKQESGDSVEEAWSMDTEGKKQRRLLFKKKRANKILTREEVKAIRKGRRKLRREMRARGLKGKRDFELTAETLGLYFDNSNSLFAWIMSHWLAALIEAMVALLMILFLFSAVIHARGYFTINLAENLVKEGYSISDTADFENPTIQIAASPSENVPCISISQIPLDIDQHEGNHYAQNYFAYTFFVRNEGDGASDYYWSLMLNSESKELSDAVWAILFVDGEMRIYAKPNGVTGEAEALPPKDDDRRGFMILPLRELAPDSDQFETIQGRSGFDYYRVIPDKFVSDRIIARGEHKAVEPQEVHKYTVVLYLEGDDVDATDEKIGGHLGIEINIQAELPDESRGTEEGLLRSVKNYFSDLWSNLKFW